MTVISFIFAVLLNTFLGVVATVIAILILAWILNKIGLELW